MVAILAFCASCEIEGGSVEDWEDRLFLETVKASYLVKIIEKKDAIQWILKLRQIEDEKDDDEEKLKHNVFMRDAQDEYELNYKEALAALRLFKDLPTKETLYDFLKQRFSFSTGE